MTDPTGLAALFGTLAEMPARLAALERAEAENAAKLDGLRAALPLKHVTVSEAAQLLNVSIPTMRRWVRKRVVPTFKVGRVLRVEVSRLRGADAADIDRDAADASGTTCPRHVIPPCRTNNNDSHGNHTTEDEGEAQRPGPAADCATQTTGRKTSSFSSELGHADGTGVRPAPLHPTALPRRQGSAHHALH
jgi:excisionase family DNA binding protein